MKIKLKSFLAALSLVIAVLSVLSLSGCDHFPTDTPTDAPVTDNAPTESPTEEEEPTDDPDSDGQIDTELSHNDEEKSPTELPNNDVLVCALIEYLQDLLVEYDLPDTSTAIKIDEIKNGKQALHVGFDDSRYYFVCAYYDNTHEDETIDYCCATNYTWVKFEDPKEIGEKHKDLSFVVAFQINKASFVADILTKDAVVPNIEHFQEYFTNFNNGLNTNGAITFDTNFIYLNSSNYKDVYHSMSAYDNVLKTLPCICLNKRYYITKELYTIYADGTRSDSNVISDLGKYYDTLVNIMDTTSYSVTDENGRTTFYGLIEINDFSNCINE